MCTKLVIKYKRLLFLGLLILFCPIFLWAQITYTYQRLNSENGLPTNAIKGLQFDAKNRFLWVATESGIVRYNGHSFQSFGDIAGNENLNGRIVFFEKTIDGRFFGKLIDESVFYIKENKVVIDTNIKLIKYQKDFISYRFKLNNLKFTNDSSLVEYLNFKFKDEIYFISNNFEYHELKKIVNGKIKKIAKFNNGEEGFTINNRFFLLQNNANVIEVLKDNNENYAFKFISKLDIPDLEFNSKSAIFKVFQNNPSEDVFVLSGTKLYKINLVNNQLNVDLILESIPKYEFIRYIQVDKYTNTIYLGTDNRGILVARPQYFKRILPNNLVNGVSTSAYAQVQLKNGNVQINTGQIFGESKKPSPTIFYRPSATTTYTTKNNHLYFTNSDGISVFDLNKFKLIEQKNNAFVNRNSFIEVDNYMLAFNEYGILKKVNNSNWEMILKFKKTPFNFIVYQLAQVNKDDILAATTDGLYKYNIKNNTFKLFFRDKNKANFRSIYDLGGYFIIGTYGSGAYMYKSDTIKKMPLDQSGFYKYVHCYVEDDKSRIWATTNKGIFMAPKQSLIDFWTVGPGKIIYQYFGKNEGIDVLELNGGCTPCAIKLNNGKISLPGIDGLIQFNPSTIPDYIINPVVYLDKYLIDNKLAAINEIKNIPFKVNRLTYHFGIAGMLSEDNIRLEYELDDDSYWTPFKINNPILNVDKPKLGSHKILIRSRGTNSPKWNTNEFLFYIQIPWYLNPWIYLIYLLIGVALVLLYIRFKTLIYQRRQEVLESEVAFKTLALNKLNRYLQKRNEAKDHVIAIMNHDVLTPLKYLHITAKNTAEQIEDLKIKNSINQIAVTSKELEYLTSNMLNWVKFDNVESLPKPQFFDLHVLVKDLVEFVSPFKQNEQVKIINEIPVDTQILSWADSVRVLLYNIIMNSIKSTSSGWIKIQYNNLGSNFELNVSDTGEGMSATMIQYLTSGHSKDEVELIPKNKKGNGIGYQIIRHLIKLMQVELIIKSKENIGTTVTLKFYNTKLD